jgi:hypothetical protein
MSYLLLFHSNNGCTNAPHYHFTRTLSDLLYVFDIQGAVHRDIVLKLIQRDALISQICFWNRTLHVSDRFPVYHQESSTAYTAIGIYHTGYAGSGWNILIPLASSQHNLYDIYLLLCVQF